MANEIDSNDVATGDTGAGAEEASEASEQPAVDVDSANRIKELEETLEKERGIRARERTEYEKQLNKAQEPAKVEVKETEDKSQSDETDYARLAFLNSQNVTHPDDQQAIIEEASRLQLPLTDILGMEHMQAKLKGAQTEREAKAGMPKGSNRSGQATRDDVDYYLQNPDKVPDNLELHNKVIDARMKKIEDSSRFSDVPFIG
jgi:hypothetical protein